MHSIATIITISSVFPFAVDAHRRALQSHHRQHGVQTAHRRTFGGAGLPKKDHLKDWRDQSNLPSETSVPTTLIPTTAPTRSPTAVPTAAPTTVPLGDGCRELLNYQVTEVSDGGPLNTLVNLQPLGINPADLFLFSNHLTIEGVVVGRTSGRCIVLQDIDNIDNNYCVMEFRFDGGFVVTQGVFYDLTIVAGTGCYMGIQGIVEAAYADAIPASAINYNFATKTDNGGCIDPEPHFASPWVGSDNSDYWFDWDRNRVFSAGDTVVFDTNYFTTSKGVSGFLEGECMDVGQADLFCLITFLTGSLSENKLMVQGPLDNMVITAGLGCFFGASGTINGSLDGNEFQLNVDDANSMHDPACPSDLFDEAWEENYGEVYVDYLADGFSEGDAYVFLDKTIRTSSKGEIGVLTGRCVVVDIDAAATYCNIVFELDKGEISVQGFFEEMAIVGASGCFQGLQGRVLGSDPLDDSLFIYNWDVFR